MKFKLTIFFITIFLNSWSQQTYFKRRVDFGPAEAGFGILRTDSSYVFAAVSPFASSIRSLVFGKINLEGMLIDYKSFNIPPGSQYIGGLIKTNDGGFACANSVRYSFFNVNTFLTKFDADGDTLWSRQYGDTLHQDGWMCKQTRDLGYIICGQTTSYDTLGDILLIKTDSNGVLQWEKILGGNNTDRAYSIDTCFDGGFIIAGSTLSYGPNTLYYFPNIYIVKTDSVGNVEWERYLGGNYGDEIESIIQAKDGNYYACGYTTVYDVHQYCCGADQDLTIIKLDSSGNIVWNKNYGEATYSAFLTSIVEDDDNNLITCGFIQDTVGYIDKSVMVKVNSLGDSLWYRTYSPGFGSYSYFYNLTPDEDKGIVSIGFMYPMSPDTGNQDIWIVKVDSNGCEMANCWSTIGITEFNSQKILSVYPNPFSAKLSVSFEDNSFFYGGYISIFNNLGKVVGKYPLDDSLSEFNIDVSFLSEGIYFVQYSNDKNIYKSVRIVKVTNN